MSLGIGSRLGPLRIEALSAERMKTMAALLQDPNPIHVRPEAVRALGIGDRVVHQGPRNIAFLMRLLGEELPQARIERFTVRFTANVFAGDDIVASGTVSAEGAAAPGRRRLECELVLDVEGGERALEATATIDLPAPGTASQTT